MGNAHPGFVRCPCPQDLLAPGSVPAGDLQKGLAGGDPAYASSQTRYTEEEGTAASLPCFYFLWPVIKYLLVSIRKTLRPVILAGQANQPREVPQHRHRVPGLSQQESDQEQTVQGPGTGRPSPGQLAPSGPARSLLQSGRALSLRTRTSCPSPNARSH